jgi:hypothetical protein
MKHIRDVIHDIDTPSWLSSVPKNFGDAAAGTLKADELRILSTVQLPIALVTLWGEGSSHETPAQAKHMRAVLDHTMSLVCAISLASKRTMTTARQNAYRAELLAWIQGLKTFHPHVNHRLNGHMAIHIYDFLRLFGPVRSWWCFPFERLIGRLQRLPHNHKFGWSISSLLIVHIHILNPCPPGELEATMLSVYSKAARLKQWLSRPDCPPFLRECKNVLDKLFTRTLDDDVNDADEPNLPASAFQPIPSELQQFIRDKTVAIRARHRYNNVIFARSSTHIGNSLVLFHPDGNIASPPFPASIQYIMANADGSVKYAVRRQQPLEHSSNPFRFYLHFPASIYSTSLSSTLEVIEPQWVISHYARLRLDESRCIVLALSRVCSHSLLLSTCLLKIYTRTEYIMFFVV